MDVDVDFFASRVESSKHQSAMQTSRHNAETHVFMDDFDGDDDIHACFPCPFCYVDIEVPVLCIHLQEEHCFDVKNLVCPVCAANLGRDMIGHFTVQHSHLLKRRRKSQRTGLWTDSSTMLSKDLRVLSSFLGVSSHNGRGKASNSSPDPLLSPFLFGLVLPDADGNQDEGFNINVGIESASLEVKSKAFTLDGAQEQSHGEQNQRAEFVQNLLLSTLF